MSLSLENNSMLVDKNKKFQNYDKNVRNEHLNKYVEYLNSQQDHYINLSYTQNSESLIKQNSSDLVNWFDGKSQKTSSKKLDKKVTHKKLLNNTETSIKDSISTNIQTNNKLQRITDDLVNRYQIYNLGQHKALFKIIYKDLSTKYFVTFMLFIFIFCTSLIKIYLTYVTTNKTIEYAQLQSEYKKLSYYHSNLQLEYLYLTSDAHIRSVLNNDVQRLLFLPIVNTREVIVVIPYNTYYSKLIRNQTDLAQ